MHQSLMFPLLRRMMVHSEHERHANPLPHSGPEVMRGPESGMADRSSPNRTENRQRYIGRDKCGDILHWAARVDG